MLSSPNFLGLNHRKRGVAINDFIDYVDGMASVTIRKLPDEVKEKLRVDAARRGISLEAYARKILREASGEGDFRAGNLVELARECFGEGVGVDLDLPSRGSGRELMAFD
jgi:plasmid stability protein